MSFAFVPRKFVKPVKPSAPPQTTSATLSTSNGSTHQDVKGKGKTVDEPNSANKDKPKPKYSDETLASLISLALSDYSLWSDSDLRRKIDLSSNTEGFIPLTYLIHHSPLLRSLGVDDNQTQFQIVKALRLHADDFIEIRLLVSQPSSSAWFGKNFQEKQGLYEIRRRDWDHSSDFPSHASSKNDWDNQTVYLENIPASYRSIPGILQFTAVLLPSPSLKTVQNIYLPPHHQDKSGDTPSCKGFAFVTLSSIEEAEHLLNHWPWDRTEENDDEGNEVLKDAIKFGFRTLPKKEWERLKEEYIAYRQRLVDEINAYQDATSSPFTPRTKHSQAESHEIQGTDEFVSEDLPFPPNVLLFVKNIHPESTKTTVRKLFAAALIDAIKEGRIENDGLDYVDFSKGVDSCYLRVVTPTHAQLLHSHFTNHPTCQTSGMDESGSPVQGTDKAIIVDLVQGKGEEVYWEKVPEKVRKMAVEKGIALPKSLSVVPSELLSEVQVAESQYTKRKRPKEEEQCQPERQTRPSSEYPFDCLIFVKNVYPETNKTTLRKLFSVALKSDGAEGHGLDYVDFSKGIDSCYLRLATPSHSHALLSHFSQHSTVQATPLDEVGTGESVGGEKRIMMELIQGKREEVYWEKVPEKVRRAAVAKALGLGSGMDGQGSGGGEGEGRKPKRRRKGKE